MNFTPQNIISIFSLLLSIALAIFYFRDRKHARFSIENSYTNELLKWHKEVIDILVRTRSLGSYRKSEAYDRDLCQLASLIEQGRFFFPNIDRGDSYEKHKPLAYWGYRNLALDFVIASYNICKSEPTDERDKQLKLLQQHFTSIVFDIVRPVERLNKIRVLTDRYFMREESFENFLSHQDSRIIEHLWTNKHDI